MSTSLERMRRLHGLGQKASKRKQKRSSADNARQQVGRDGYHLLRPGELSCRSAGAASCLPTEPLSTAVPGEEIENSGGTCYVVTHSYPVCHLRGGNPLDAILEYSPSLLSELYPTFRLDDDSLDFSTAAFLDTETTGLGTGAGIYCFMVGVGQFEHQFTPRSVSLDGTTLPLETDSATEAAQSESIHFVVRQLFMRSPAEECALLVALAELLSQSSLMVTFNGRAFDLPLLRTRLKQNLSIFPSLSPAFPLLQEESPHLDLLLPARRLWRRRLQSCRLGRLEEALMGILRSEEDVPGQLIPALYADYLKTRHESAGEMPRIFYHNREDILSMVGLTPHLYAPFTMLEQTTSDMRKWPVRREQEDMSGIDWLSMGLCYASIGSTQQAEQALLEACKRLGRAEDEVRSRAEAYKHLGQLYKAQSNWSRAAEVWQEWITTIADDDPMPYIELAKYCEWQQTDLSQAEMWTRWAIHMLNSQTKLMPRTDRLLAELDHRLSRICRKQSR